MCLVEINYAEGTNLYNFTLKEHGGGVINETLKYAKILKYIIYHKIRYDIYGRFTHDTILTHLCLASLKKGHWQTM